jgi:hypothetical protein
MSNAISNPVAPDFAHRIIEGLISFGLMDEASITKLTDELGKSPLQALVCGDIGFALFPNQQDLVFASGQWIFYNKIQENPLKHNCEWSVTVHPFGGDITSRSLHEDSPLYETRRMQNRAKHRRHRINRWFDNLWDEYIGVKKIIIAHDGYGKHYFAASTEKERNYAYIEMLKLVQNGLSHFDLSKEVEPSFSREVAATLPLELRKEALEMWDRYDKSAKSNSEKNDYVARVRKALDTNDSMEALALIEQNSINLNDFVSYEQVVVECPPKV